MLLDSHAHLGHRQFHSNLPDVLARAAAAGVSRCVMPATDLENSRELIQLAAQYPQLHACVGIHPCDVHTVPTLSAEELNPTWLGEMRSLAQTPGIAALGETGMDFYHPPEEGFTLEQWRTQQARVLKLHMLLGQELGLNVILHARECHAELVEEVRLFTGLVRCVFHCFTGTLEQALEVVAMGHLVSFTGVVTYKRSEQIQAAAAGLPAGSFMIETDSPFLAPVPHRGKTCEPAFSADTAKFIAQLRGESFEQLATHTNQAAQAFFRGL
jgi:TatD DNase family protein